MTLLVRALIRFCPPGPALNPFPPKIYRCVKKSDVSHSRTFWRFLMVCSFVSKIRYFEDSDFGMIRFQFSKVQFDCSTFLYSMPWCPKKNSITVALSPKRLTLKSEHIEGKIEVWCWNLKIKEYTEVFAFHTPHSEQYTPIFGGHTWPLRNYDFR